MARYWFGAGISDWGMTTGDGVTLPGVVAAEAVIVGGVTVTFWNARTGGTRYTDLRNEAGSAVTAVTASNGTDGFGLGQIPPVQGPDNVRKMWASAGDGPRALLIGQVDAVDRAGDTMTGALVLADGSRAASEAYAVSKAGDTMTGPLSVPTPTAAAHAATKAYVDSAVAAGGGGGGSVAWEAVTGKPATFPPSSHGHSIEQVSGLTDALNAKAATAHDHLNRVAGYRWTGTTYVVASDARLFAGPVDPASLGLTVPDGSVWIDTSGGA
ncbi:hypothetical protein ACIBTV_27430 [Micromonospora sp. NPDC049366]|uniref:hypothetical protein n=1 Tax=Micromonospora sp. NPDC049366 TaxID=3364271 RepID=UPI0037BB91A7